MRSEAQHLTSRYLQSFRDCLDVIFVENRPVMCTKVWFYGAKNSISASDSSQTENPIKAWAFHTPTLLRRTQ